MSGNTATSGTTEMAAVIVEPAVVPEVQVEMAQAIEKSRIQDIVDLSKNGSYCINLEVREGQITWGTLQTNTYQDLMLAKEQEIETQIDKLTTAYETKLAAIGKINETLQHGETKTSNAPEASDVKLSKADYMKAAIQEKKNNNK
jgi:hypothetical protein